MKTVFLDRDGTVIVEPADERVDSAAEIELFPDTLAALRYLADHDFDVILVTNQAGIGEGRFTRAEFERTHNEVLEHLAPSGVRILKTYVCPHTSAGGCVCRKPQPAMLLEAAEEFDLDLSGMFMVGDRLSDVLTGANAGTRTVLVKTGNDKIDNQKAEYTAPTLLDAVQYVVAHS